jgi:ATP-dependent Clp protease ATP-binding subunit ClpB
LILEDSIGEGSHVEFDIKNDEIVVNVS